MLPCEAPNWSCQERQRFNNLKRAGVQVENRGWCHRFGGGEPGERTEPRGEKKLMNLANVSVSVEITAPRAKPSMSQTFWRTLCLVPAHFTNSPCVYETQMPGGSRWLVNWQHTFFLPKSKNYKGERTVYLYCPPICLLCLSFLRGACVLSTARLNLPRKLLTAELQAGET